MKTLTKSAVTKTIAAIFLVGLSCVASFAQSKAKMDKDRSGGNLQRSEPKHIRAGYFEGEVTRWTKNQLKLIFYRMELFVNYPYRNVGTYPLEFSFPLPVQKLKRIFNDPAQKEALYNYIDGIRFSPQMEGCPPNGNDFSTTDDGDICVSIGNLSWQPPAALELQIYSGLAHEVGHYLKLSEENCQRMRDWMVRFPQLMISQEDFERRIRKFPAVELARVNQLIDLLFEAKTRPTDLVGQNSKFCIALGRHLGAVTDFWLGIGHMRHPEDQALVFPWSREEESSLMRAFHVLEPLDDMMQVQRRLERACDDAYEYSKPIEGKKLAYKLLNELYLATAKMAQELYKYAGPKASAFTEVAGVYRVEQMASEFYIKHMADPTKVRPTTEGDVICELSSSGGVEDTIDFKIKGKTISPFPDYSFVLRTHYTSWHEAILENYKLQPIFIVLDRQVGRNHLKIDVLEKDGIEVAGYELVGLLAYGEQERISVKFNVSTEDGQSKDYDLVCKLKN